MLPPSRTHLWILALLYGVTLVYLNLYADWWRYVVNYKTPKSHRYQPSTVT